MNQGQIRESANILWQHWMRSEQISELPGRCRPADRNEAYAIQAQLAQLSAQQVFGWKIAATSNNQAPPYLADLEGSEEA